MNLQDYQKFEYLTHQFLDVHDDSQKQEIENDLEQYYMTNKVYLLFQILNNNHQIPSKIEKMCLTLIKKACNIVEEQNIYMPQDLIQCILDTVYNTQVQFQIKKQIISSADQIFFEPFGQDKNKWSAKEHALEYIQSKPLIDEQNQIILDDSLSFVLILYKLIRSINKGVYFTIFYKKIYLLLRNYYENIVYRLQNDIDNITINPNQLDNLQQQFTDTQIYEQIKKYLLIIYYYTKVQRACFELFQKHGNHQIQQVTQSLEFTIQMKQLLYIKLNSLQKDKNNFIFNCLVIEQLNILMDKIKKNVLIILNIVFRKLNQTSKKDSNDYSIIVNHFIGINKEILTCLRYFYKQNINCNTYGDLSQDKSITSLIRKSLSLLNQACKNQKFYDFFQDVYQEMFAEILLPNLISNEQDIDNFQDNIIEFFNYQNDITTALQSKTIKVMTSKFLRVISKNIDGSVIYITNILLTIIQDTIDQNLENLKSLLNENSILIQIDDILRIDCCFLGLNVITQSISQRQELSEKVLQFMISFSKTKFYQNQLLKTRFLSFFQQFLNQVSKNQSIQKEIIQDFKEKLFQFYIEELNTTENNINDIIIYYVEDFLQYEENQFIVKQKFDLQLIRKFLDICQNSDSKNLLKLLQALIKSSLAALNDHPDLYQHLLNTLFKKISQEMTQQKDNYRLRLNIIWSTLTEIARFDSLSINFNQIFFSESYFLLLNFQLLVKQDQEDNFIELMTDIIMVSGQIPVYIDQLLQILLEFIKKQYKQMGLYKKIFSVIMCKNQEFFNSNIINEILKICFQCFIDEQSQAPDYYFQENILFLISLILNAGEQLSQQNVDDIYSLYILLRDNLSQQIKQDNLRENQQLYAYQDLNRMLFLSLVYKQCQQLLQNGLQIILHELNQITINLEHYSTEMERKILILALINIISQLWYNDEFIGLTQNLLSTIICFLKFYENLNIAKHIIRQNNLSVKPLSLQNQVFINVKNSLQNRLFKQKIDSFWFDQIDHDESNPDDEKYTLTPQEILGLEDMNIQLRIKELKQNSLDDVYFKIDKLDEYKILNDTLMQFQKLNQERFNTIVQKLDSMAQQYAQEVLQQIRYVKLNDGKFVIRKILTIKNKQLILKNILLQYKRFFLNVNSLSK